MVDRFERFSLALSELFRYWHRIASDELAPYGLKGTHATYLTAMYRHPQGLSATQLCEECGKDKADVSRMLSILEKKGFIRREGASYRALVTLTAEGKALAEHVRERAAVAVEAASRGLSDEHRAIFYHALELITANLQTICRDGLPAGTPLHHQPDKESTQ